MLLELLAAARAGGPVVDTALVGLVGAGCSFVWRELRRAQRRRALREDRSNAILTTVTSLDERMARVDKELQANGGGSLRDAINDIRTRVSLSDAARMLSTHAATWEGVVGADGVVRPFRVSPEYRRLTGLTVEDTMHGGWIRCVDPADRDRVQELADEAEKHGRVFEATYFCVNVQTRQPVLVQHLGHPVTNGQGVIVAWVGVITPLTPSHP